MSYRILCAENESANRLSQSPYVFEKFDFEKKKNVNFQRWTFFEIKTVIIIRLLVPSNYSINPHGQNDIS